MDGKCLKKGGKRKNNKMLVKRWRRKEKLRIKCKKNGNTNLMKQRIHK